MKTPNGTTGSAAPTSTAASNNTSAPKDPSVALSEGLLKLNWLNGLSDLRQAQRANQELLAAQLERQYGKPVMTPGEDMIAVESPITQTTNNYLPAQQAPAAATLPKWLKVAAVAMGLAGAGGLGALTQFLGRPAAPGVPVKPNPMNSERAYQLDFWDPTELPAPAR